MDFLCVGLPIFFLRNLQAKLGRKISLFVLLGLGLFTAACAILRATSVDFADKDFTWHTVPVVFWSCLEQNIGIIVASTPAAHQLYTLILQKYFPHCVNNQPYLRSLGLRTSSGYANTSDGSHHYKIRLGSRGSQSMGMMSNAGSGGGCGGTILPGPPSPTKKEPRTDYDKALLDTSPKLGQAAKQDEESSYLGLC
ncbi:hypothetical protein HO173_000376 [Letharia columbiana]|uniref:Rhodopsin domain-containing protein n=1 Tax=Letharia columbiana TaxID=112416 RepID=A0A8H6G772_9LECA|nr:uncharacterized protein HO173_000376 [Letharia columbiana]KAF6241665.1 hypothetical protein HO173_000376 [Letharia columbiana]